MGSGVGVFQEGGAKEGGGEGRGEGRGETGGERGTHGGPVLACPQVLLAPQEVEEPDEPCPEATLTEEEKAAESLRFKTKPGLVVPQEADLGPHQLDHGQWLGQAKVLGILGEVMSLTIPLLG